jgi:hypothetical protein
MAHINAKCKDLCFVDIGGQEHDGYVPSDMGIGGGDYVEIDLCLNCGHVQGDWPLAETKLERMNINRTPDAHRTFEPDPAYTDFIHVVQQACEQAHMKGANVLFDVLFTADNDARRLIQAVQVIYMQPEFRHLAEMVIDLLQDWEHVAQLRNAIIEINQDFEDWNDDD